MEIGSLPRGKATPPSASRRLRRAAQSQPLGQSETPLVRSARARIEKVLDSLTELELFETPLDEVVNLIKENHRIEVQIDKQALDDVGIATDTLITKSLKGITLRSALNLMLHELDLTWIIIDEVLLITLARRGGRTIAISKPTTSPT